MQVLKVQIKTTTDKVPRLGFSWINSHCQLQPINPDPSAHWYQEPMMIYNRSHLAWVKKQLLEVDNKETTPENHQRVRDLTRELDRMIYADVTDDEVFNSDDEVFNSDEDNSLVRRDSFQYISDQVRKPSGLKIKNRPIKLKESELSVLELSVNDDIQTKPKVRFANNNSEEDVPEKPKVPEKSKVRFDDYNYYKVEVTIGIKF